MSTEIVTVKVTEVDYSDNGNIELGSTVGGIWGDACNTCKFNPNIPRAIYSCQVAKQSK